MCIWKYPVDAMQHARCVRVTFTDTLTTMGTSNTT